MKVPQWVQWTSVVFLALGAILVSGGWEQQTPELRRPLAEVAPDRFGEYVGEDVEISEAEARVAGFTDYLMRVYEQDDRGHWASAYVGYYDTQARGKTIHSPKNCLPGAGWEALQSTRVTLTTDAGEEIEVNRYLLQREGEQALVLYWYQGRGRVVASEYRAKWDLLRDAALHRRSDEALVRVVVPIVEGESAAFALASDIAGDLKMSVDRAMPL